MYGQELNPESYAICKADMLIKGQDIGNIIFGNTLSADGLIGKHFDYMLSNPPFGVEWKKIEKEVRSEAEQQGFNGRFGPGLPRVSDGSLLFLLHLISKMRPAEDGGSRFGIVLNGSPLFTGGAGSGESEIRRLRARERPRRGHHRAAHRHVLQHRHQHLRLDREQPQAEPLARARCSSSTPAASGRRCARASAASARSCSPAHIDDITKHLRRVRRRSRAMACPSAASSRTSDFGYRTITVERPERDCQGQGRARHEGQGKGQARARRRTCATPRTCRSARTSTTYFEREVLPHAADAWIDDEKTKVGYEIPFNRHFYVFKPPRALERDRRRAEGRHRPHPDHDRGADDMSFPRYAKYKDSGVEWLGEVPEHWDVCASC